MKSKRVRNVERRNHREGMCGHQKMGILKRVREGERGRPSLGCGLSRSWNWFQSQLVAEECMCI